MKILAIDIGTGTQDIFLYDTRLDIENGYKMVVPSPTLMVHQRLKNAAGQGRSVALTGCLMGGGPSTWGVESLLKAGLAVYATPQAASSINDDLSVVQAMGIILVSEDEAAALPEAVEQIEMRDFDFPTIAKSFQHFNLQLNDLSAIAVGVFDHGNAPAGVSDRQFRFDYLNERIRSTNRVSTENPAALLSCFAFLPENIPTNMTRMQAVVDSAADIDVPMVVMDTAPAAVLGACFDTRVRERMHTSVIVVNVGNMHTLAFRLGPQGVEGLFEHHTGFLDTQNLDDLLQGLANVSLKHEDVFGNHGHGALLYTKQKMIFPPDDFGVAVTGPRRGLMTGSILRPYFPAPFGDMMLTGCFCLLGAVSELIPETRSAIRAALLQSGVGSRAPWDSHE